MKRLIKKIKTQNKTTENKPEIILFCFYPESFKLAYLAGLLTYLYCSFNLPIGFLEADRLPTVVQLNERIKEIQLRE